MSTAGKAFGVDTSPTKDVVVSGLTRDATVEACILDLIDNSVDAVRENARRTPPEDVHDNYHGWEIELTLGGTGFKIQRQRRRHSRKAIAIRRAPVWKASRP